MGQILGTPDYLAPEQALDARNVTPAADLYSLGCTLYAMLAGRAPYQAEGLAELLMKHQMEAPEPLRRARPDVPEALEAYVDHLMEKNPADRPRSADEVAEALAAFTGAGGGSNPGLPAAPRSRARGETWAELEDEGSGIVRVRKRDRSRDTLAEDEDEPRPRRSIDKLRGRKGEETQAPRRLPLFVGLGVGAVVLFGVLGTLVAVVFGGKRDANKEHSLAARGEPERSAKRKAKLEIKDETKPPKGKEKGPKLPEVDQKPPVEVEKFEEPEGFSLKGHMAAVICLAVSPDGRLIASGGDDHRLIVWDRAKRTQFKSFGGYPGVVKQVAFSSDGKRLTAVVGNVMKEWHIADWTPTKRWDVKADFIAPGLEIGLLFEPGKVKVVNLTDRKEMKTLDLAEPEVRDVCFSPDGKQALVLGRIKAITRIDLERLSARRDGFVPAGGSRAIAWASDWRVLVGFLDGGFVFAYLGKDSWSGVAGVKHRSDGDVRCLDCPDGRSWLSASMDGTVLYCHNGRPPRRILGKHPGGACTVMFAPNKKAAISGGADGLVRLWPLSRTE
jgi:hypothetical protein